MVTCQSSELGLVVTVELSADSLSIGKGSVKLVSEQFISYRIIFIMIFLLQPILFF